MIKCDCFNYVNLCYWNPIKQRKTCFICTGTDYKRKKDIDFEIDFSKSGITEVLNE